MYVYGSELNRLFSHMYRTCFKSTPHGLVAYVSIYRNTHQYSMHLRLALAEIVKSCFSSNLSFSLFLVLHNVLASTSKSVHVLEDVVYRKVWQRVRWWNIAGALTDSAVEQSAHCAASFDRAQGNRPHVACRHRSQ